MQQGRQLVILLCGGDKSSQNRDIKQARLIAKALGTIARAGGMNQVARDAGLSREIPPDYCMCNNRWNRKLWTVPSHPGSYATAHQLSSGECGSQNSPLLSSPRASSVNGLAIEKGTTYEDASFGFGNWIGSSLHGLCK